MKEELEPKFPYSVPSAEAARVQSPTSATNGASINLSCYLSAALPGRLRQQQNEKNKGVSLSQTNWPLYGAFLLLFFVCFLFGCLFFCLFVCFYLVHFSFHFSYLSFRALCQFDDISIYTFLSSDLFLLVNLSWWNESAHYYCQKKIICMPHFRFKITLLPHPGN